MNKTVIPAYETSDGAGVKIYRSLGQTQTVRLDPFLMLDEFVQKIPMTISRAFHLTPIVVLKRLPI